MKEDADCNYLWRQWDIIIMIIAWLLTIKGSYCSIQQLRNNLNGKCSKLIWTNSNKFRSLRPFLKTKQC